MNEHIVLLKLYSGDYIIGDKIGESSDSVSLGNPRVFVFMPTATGQVSAGFQPICLFSKKLKEYVDIKSVQILAEIEENNLPKELINGYKSEISGIKIASPDEVSAVSGGKDIIV